MSAFNWTRDSFKAFCSALLRSLPTLLQNVHRSVCPIRYPHKSAETIYQANQYAFRIWLIPAVSWQALSAVPHLICQAVPVRIVFQIPAHRTGHAANFQELSNRFL